MSLKILKNIIPNIDTA